MGTYSKVLLITKKSNLLFLLSGSCAMLNKNAETGNFNKLKKHFFF